MVRLQKYLADCGVASRRAAEQFIAAGRVKVNGQMVQELGKKVHPDDDRVEVDGSRVRMKKKVYLALHKPRGYLCTRQDPHGRRTVMSLLPKEWGAVYPAIPRVPVS